MRALPLTLWLAACSPPRGEGGTTEAIMDSLPDYGGCSWMFTIDNNVDGIVDQSQVIDYDDQQRAVRGAVVYAGVLTVEVTVSYDDAGCLVSSSTALDYDDATFPDYDSRVDAYAQTCDALGNPVTQVGVSDDRPYEVALTNSYEGEDLVRVDREVIWRDTDERASTSDRYAWAGGRLTAQLSSEEGVQTQQETWTYDVEGHTLSDALDNYLYPELGWTQTWTYDDHGRPESELYETADSGPRYSSQASWYSAIYHEHVRRWHRGGSLDTGSIDTWDCDADWPWSCAWTTDGELYDADDPPDGAADLSGTEVWTCP